MKLSETVSRRSHLTSSRQVGWILFLFEPHHQSDGFALFDIFGVVVRRGRGCASPDGPGTHISCPQEHPPRCPGPVGRRFSSVLVPNLTSWDFSAFCLSLSLFRCMSHLTSPRQNTSRLVCSVGIRPLVAMRTRRMSDFSKFPLILVGLSARFFA